MYLSPTKAQTVWILALTGAGIVASANLLWTLILWFKLHPHLPWRDISVILQSLSVIVEGGMTLADIPTFFEAHYAAHRIAIPRLLIYWDMKFFDGQNHALYFSNFLSLTIILLATLYMLFAASLTRKAGVFVLFISIGILFSPANLWNLINPINSSWSIGLAFSLLAFLTLSLRSHSNIQRWILAYGLAIASSLCTFSGVICVLLLPIFSWRYNWQTTLTATLATVLYTTLYLNNISADAEIALDWTVGSPEMLAKIKAEALSAIDANTPISIAARTLTLLAWPMSREWPFIGLSCSLISFAVVLISLTVVLKNRRQPEHATEFFLAITLLCIGTSVAIMLGRVLERPVEIHGPSEERFQTLISVYWIAIVSLMMLLVRTRSSKFQALSACILFPLSCVLMTPWGDYLREEIRSTEAAALLLSRAEADPQLTKKEKHLIQYKPERILLKDAFYAQRKLSYYAEQPGDGFILTSDCFLQGGDGKATITPIGYSNLFVRSFYTLSSNSHRYRIVPIHIGNYTALELIQPIKWRWASHSKLSTSQPFQLMAESALPIKPSCANSVSGQPD